MRILHTVELYDPSVGGAQEVVRQLSKRLVQRGHAVTVATRRLPARRSERIDGVHIREFSITGNAVRGMRGELDAYRSFVREAEFDVMMSYAAQQWTVDALLGGLDRIPRPHAIAPCGFSGLHDPRYSDYFRALPEHLRECEALVFHSNSYQDIAFARAHGLQRLTVIPNGADEREFGDLDVLERQAQALRARYEIAPDTPLLLTVGGHTGEKGHALAIEALRALEVPRAVLVIAGNDPLGIGCRYSCRVRAANLRARSRGRKRVLLLRVPREQVLAAYRAADVFVFGSAIECSPLVLFEAMAAGTPFVTLDVGNAAEIARWSNGAGTLLPTSQLERGRVRGDATDMAAAVAELLADREKRTRMGEAGRRAWQERFTWDAVTARYEALYERLLRGELPLDAPPSPALPSRAQAPPPSGRALQADR